LIGSEYFLEFRLPQIKGETIENFLEYRVQHPSSYQLFKRSIPWFIPVSVPGVTLEAGESSEVLLITVLLKPEMKVTPCSLNNNNAMYLKMDISNKSISLQ
jgi:hypothetical protein